MPDPSPPHSDPPQPGRGRPGAERTSYGWEVVLGKNDPTKAPASAPRRPPLTTYIDLIATQPAPGLSHPVVAASIVTGTVPTARPMIAPRFQWFGFTCDDMAASWLLIFPAANCREGAGCLRPTGPGPCATRARASKVAHSRMDHAIAQACLSRVFLGSRLTTLHQSAVRRGWSNRVWRTRCRCLRTSHESWFR